MKKSSFWLQVGILCLGFVALNLFTKRFVRGAVPHLILNKIKSTPDPTHIFVGNSVMAMGARPEVVQARIPASRPINTAIGGSHPADYFLVFNEIKTSPADKPRVYLGFFDRQLTDADDSTWSDLMSNRSFCYLADMNQSLRLLASDKPLLNLQMRLTHALPVLVERGTIWNRVEVMKRKVGSMGVPKEKTNEFGRVSDFAALEENDTKKFADKCEAAVRQNSAFAPSIASIVEQTKERGGKLYFIEMPMPSLHRQKFYGTPQWSAYSQHIKTLVTQAGAQYVDCSKSIPDELFSDPLHMTKTGGEIFTTKLLPYMK